MSTSDGRLLAKSAKSRVCTPGLGLLHGGGVAEVVLEVRLALREHHHVALVQGVGVDPVVGGGADEAARQGALHHEDELRGRRVPVQRHHASYGEVDARRRDAQPVHAGEAGDEGRGQADLERVHGRACGAQAAVVEVVGGDRGLGLARVAGRRVAAAQVGHAELLGQLGLGDTPKEQGQQQGEQGQDEEHNLCHGVYNLKCV